MLPVLSALLALLSSPVSMAQTPSSGFVTGSASYVRNAPKGEVVATLPYGYPIEIVQSGEWTQIRTPGGEVEGVLSDTLWSSTRPAPTHHRVQVEFVPDGAWFCGCSNVYEATADRYCQPLVCQDLEGYPAQKSVWGTVRHYAERNLRTEDVIPKDVFTSWLSAFAPDSPYEKTPDAVLFDAFQASASGPGHLGGVEESIRREHEKRFGPLPEGSGPGLPKGIVQGINPVGVVQGQLALRSPRFHHWTGLANPHLLPRLRGHRGEDPHLVNIDTDSHHAVLWSPERKRFEAPGQAALAFHLQYGAVLIQPENPVVEYLTEQKTAQDRRELRAVLEAFVLLTPSEDLAAALATAQPTEVKARRWADDEEGLSTHVERQYDLNGDSSPDLVIRSTLLDDCYHYGRVSIHLWVDDTWQSTWYKEADDFPCGV